MNWTHQVLSTFGRRSFLSAKMFLNNVGKGMPCEMSEVLETTHLIVFTISSKILKALL